MSRAFILQGAVVYLQYLYLTCKYRCIVVSKNNRLLLSGIEHQKSETVLVVIDYQRDNFYMRGGKLTLNGVGSCSLFPATFHIEVMIHSLAESSRICLV